MTWYRHDKKTSEKQPRSLALYNGITPTECGAFALQYTQLGKLASYDGCGDEGKKRKNDKEIYKANRKELAKAIKEAQKAQKTLSKESTQKNKAEVLRKYHEAENYLERLKDLQENPDAKYRCMCVALANNFPRQSAVAFVPTYPKFIVVARMWMSEANADALTRAVKKHDSKNKCPSDASLPVTWTRPVGMVEAVRSGMLKEIRLIKNAQDSAWRDKKGKDYYKIHVPRLGANSPPYCIFRRYNHFKLLHETIFGGKLQMPKDNLNRFLEFERMLKNLADPNNADPYVQAALLDFLTPDALIQQAIQDRFKSRKRFSVQDDSLNARLFFADKRVAKLVTAPQADVIITADMIRKCNGFFAIQDRLKAAKTRETNPPRAALIDEVWALHDEVMYRQEPPKAAGEQRKNPAGTDDELAAQLNKEFDLTLPQQTARPLDGDISFFKFSHPNAAADTNMAGPTVDPKDLPIWLAKCE